MPEREEIKTTAKRGGKSLRKTTSRCSGFEKYPLDNKQPGWEGAAGSLWRGRARCSTATSGGLISSWSRSAEGSPGVGTWGLGEGQILKKRFPTTNVQRGASVETCKMTPPLLKAF